MDHHQKGRITRNANNKPLMFLGAYLAVGAAFLAFCTRFMNFKCCGGKKWEE